MATIESPNQIDESPKLKTLFFKVPIQCACEGCKKKVKRILFKVQGVDSVDVDIRQQKVTVTGDVKAEALIKKMAKHGKEARIWPENAFVQHKNIVKDNNKEKQSDPETSKPADVKPPEKVIATAEESVKVGEASSTGGGGADGEKTRIEREKPETGSGGNLLQKSVDNLSTETDNIVAEKKKKKTKRGQNGALTDAAPAYTGSRNNSFESDASPANHSPTRHQGYQFHQPPQFSTPPTPVYAVSYSTANPSNSHTASFYSQPQPYSYAYSQADPVFQQPPYLPSYPYQMQQAPALDRDAYPGQLLNSFEMLNDENPNGCFTM